MTQPEAAPVWEQRFRAARMSLPQWAEDAPQRCLFVSNMTGTSELYAWDRSTGEQRQVTDRPNGTHDGALDPAGEHVWWFADTDGDEFGIWMRQPFAGGVDEPAVPGLEPSYPAGLCLGRDGTVVVGRSTDDGTSITVQEADGTPRVLYEHEQSAHAADLTRDCALLVIEHSEHGDSRHMALRILRVSDGTTLADLWDGEGKGLAALGFAPAEGDTRLLVRHERRGRGELLIWDVVTGEVSELDLELPGDVSGEWFQDGAAVLVEHESAARSELFRYDLSSGSHERLDIRPGVVSDATTRPDGSVEFSWSDSATPEQVRSTRGGVLVTPPGPAAPPSVPVTDVWVDGPGGRIHALLSVPPSGEGPYPVVFLVHGGPTWLDSDAFVPAVAAWVDSGFAVVRVNYRGSTGYGSAWRDAIEESVGHTELADIAAVSDFLVDNGTVDPTRAVLAGGSWGGYLTLLGLGTQPERWTVGIAAVPVADFIAAYEDEMEALRAFDRSLFGGSPEEVPERYEMSSPITYVEYVRAPVLILAGENDPRCPIRQIENYLARLDERGVPHETYRYDAGHGSLVVEERIRQMALEMDFARRHLFPEAEPAAADPRSHQEHT